MLRKLRFKVTLVIAVIGAIVMGIMLASSVYTTAQAQHLMIDSTLENGLHGSLNRIPRLGTSEADGSSYTMPVMAVEVNSSGAVIATNDSASTIDVETLGEVVETALESDSDSGSLKSPPISWRRGPAGDGYRIVMVDTSATDYVIRNQVVLNIVILGVGFLALLGIAWWLSSWLLQPVVKAWEQQRRFVADASHELKTPLAVIIANTEILSKDPSISEDAQRWVRSTADESSHMKGLVEELLELARADETSLDGAGNIMHQEDVDFSAQVDSAALEFDAISFERGCTIESNVEEGLHITGDPEWTRRLVRILIDNAIKYATAGSAIGVSLTREGKRCRLSVNNKGDVIDPEDLEHVFDRFYRSDKARTRQPGTGGFGLGLAIAKGITTSHKGKIWATSTAEEGTTFTVTLPLR